MIDISGHVLAWNKAMTVISGRSEEEIRAGKMSHAQAVYGEDRPMLIDKIIRPDLDISRYYTNVNEENGNFAADLINHCAKRKIRYEL